MLSNVEITHWQQILARNAKLTVCPLYMIPKFLYYNQETFKGFPEPEGLKLMPYMRIFKQN